MAFPQFIKVNIYEKEAPSLPSRGKMAAVFYKPIKHLLIYLSWRPHCDDRTVDQRLTPSPPPPAHHPSVL
ncbi:hypothetical protein DAPPUDRAFT_253819 [Daphnia pulex]|uniref:Uncharacterized protein n=1 Tax=Daphnia pulex TaxID=6669 RepID=E9H5H8_DAPPU|nr:hypothetical protein DAPPUDRAFT_253819 [Daphnia pulex]|eukprot:EFX72997.1 hypothetical protein DAPPUDRAFT_253819 [Daphnia pulex]